MPASKQQFYLSDLLQQKFIGGICEFMDSTELSWCLSHIFSRLRTAFQFLQVASRRNVPVTWLTGVAVIVKDLAGNHFQGRKHCSRETGILWTASKKLEIFRGKQRSFRVRSSLCTEFYQAIFWWAVAVSRSVICKTGFVQHRPGGVLKMHQWSKLCQSTNSQKTLKKLLLSRLYLVEISSCLSLERDG